MNHSDPSKLLAALVIASVVGACVASTGAAADSWRIHGPWLGPLNTARLGRSDNLLRRSVRAFGHSEGGLQWDQRLNNCTVSWPNRGVTIKFANCWNPFAAVDPTAISTGEDFGGRCFWQATVTSPRWSASGISGKSGTARIGMTRSEVIRQFGSSMVSFDGGKTYSLGFTSAYRKVWVRFHAGRVSALLFTDLRLEVQGDDAVAYLLGCGV